MKEKLDGPTSNPNCSISGLGNFCKSNSDARDLHRTYFIRWINARYEVSCPTTLPRHERYHALGITDAKRELALYAGQKLNGHYSNYVTELNSRYLIDAPLLNPEFHRCSSSWHSIRFSTIKWNIYGNLVLFRSWFATWRDCVNLVDTVSCFIVVLLLYLPAAPRRCNCIYGGESVIKSNPSWLFNAAVTIPLRLEKVRAFLVKLWNSTKCRISKFP